MTAETAYIDLHKLIVNGGSQPRAALDEETIARYAEAMENGADFPPIVVFYDGENYWLADGYHRRKAALKAQYALKSDVRQGKLRDAILYSVSANNGHGLPSSNADRRRAVLTLLNDAEWSRWSDREIARRCGVSPDTVGRLRRSGGEFDRFDDVSWIAQDKIKPSILSDSDSMERVFVHPKTGRPTTMRTANIGRTHSASEEEWAAVRDALSNRDDSDSRGAADKWLESGDDDGFDEVGSDFDPQAEINNILKALGGTRRDPLRLYNQWRILLMRFKAEGRRTSDYLFGQTEGEINDLILDRIKRAYPKVSKEDIEEAAARESQRILAGKAAEEAAYKAARLYGSFEETLSLFEQVGQALASHPDRAPKHEQQVRRICHIIIETGFGLAPRTAKKGGMK